MRWVVSTTSLAMLTAAVSTIAFAAPPPVLNAPGQVRTTSPQPPVHNPDPQPGSPSSAQYTAIEFTVWTGDDDLRSSSWVAAQVNFPDGTTQTCTIHGVQDGGWDNNTKHQGRQCILSAAKPWKQLTAARIVMRYTGPGSYSLAQTPDNWNVNEVRVVAIDSADKLYPCLLDAKGSPLLVRMTEDVTSYDLTETENRC